MINFNYLLRGSSRNPLELREISSNLETIGYQSVLLTFHSKSADYFIKAAAALVSGDKIKYMLALRPYHMSPQYLAMVVKAFDEIDKNRISINFLAGGVDSMKGEPEQTDIYGNTESLDSIVKRTEFVRQFVDQYKFYSFTNSTPELIFSGHSEYTIETAKILNGTSLSMIDDYRNNIDRFSEIKNIMVSVCPIILDSELEAEEYKKFLHAKSYRYVDMSIIGTRDFVKEKLLLLETEGITDAMINTHRWEFNGMPHELSEKNDILVNELIKEICHENGKIK